MSTEPELNAEQTPFGGLARWVTAVGLGLVLVSAVALFGPALASLARGRGAAVDLPSAGVDPGAPWSVEILAKSKPAGAAVVVQGEARGTTPALLNATCRAGEAIRIRLSKRGFAAAEQTFECDRDRAELRIDARLRRQSN